MLTKAQQSRMLTNKSFYQDLFAGLENGTVGNMLDVISRQGRDFRAMEFLAFVVGTIPGFDVTWLTVTADKLCPLAVQSIRFTALDCFVGNNEKLYAARRTLQVEFFQGTLNVGYRKIRPGATVASFIDNYDKQTQRFIAIIQRDFSDPLECIRVVSEVMIQND